MNYHPGKLSAQFISTDELQMDNLLGQIICLFAQIIQHRQFRLQVG